MTAGSIMLAALIGAVIIGFIYRVVTEKDGDPFDGAAPLLFVILLPLAVVSCVMMDNSSAQKMMDNSPAQKEQFDE